MLGRRPVRDRAVQRRVVRVVRDHRLQRDASHKKIKRRTREEEEGFVSESGRTEPSALAPGVTRMFEHAREKGKSRLARKPTAMKSQTLCRMVGRHAVS